MHILKFTNIIYEALTYLKSHNKFYEDISMTKVLSSEGRLRFFDILEIESAAGKIIPDECEVQIQKV